MVWFVVREVHVGVCSHEGRGTLGCEHKGVPKPQENA
jgi:hypothetical protein